MRRISSIKIERQGAGARCRSAAHPRRSERVEGKAQARSSRNVLGGT
ncbi:MAG: hypothetical protein OJF60_003233 [Burkholderiaceae bacterium]|nr:MAG: hypothetical protein OJF60_003233 [Burkholderiaceae bacterium]